MNDCLPQLKEISDSMIADFDRRVAQIPQDMCAPFYAEAARLETELLMIHKFVVSAVRREEDLETVAKQWASMVKICDVALSKISTLSKRHPTCGAQFYYDRILDLRASCARLQTMHS